MVASYPASLRPFIVKTDFVDKVLAENVNSLQEEISAVESTIGLNPHISTAPNPALTFATTSITYANLAARLANIEIGVVSDAHTQYIKNNGGAVVTTSTNSVIPLTVQQKSGQTADIFRVINSSGGTVFFNIDNVGNVFFSGQSLPQGRVASAKNTSNSGGGGAGNETMLTGLTNTFTAVSGRRYRVTLTCCIGDAANTANGMGLRLRDGTTTGSAQLFSCNMPTTVVNSGFGGVGVNFVWYLDSLSAGTHNLTPSVTSTVNGNLQIIASATVPATLVTEDVGT